MNKPNLIQQPLEGIRVVDLTHVLAGPYCTLLMALNGAEVIKIEPPRVGELSRKQLITSKDGREVQHDEVYLHRNKKGVALNLRSDKGKEIFKRLVEVSDVVIENYSPKTMKKLGLGYEELKRINPRVVYTSLSGFGHEDIYRGPYSNRPAFNAVIQAMSGIMDMTGEAEGPPQIVGFTVGDLIPAVYAFAATLMALRMRDATGMGQHVDVAMYDCMVSMAQRPVIKYYLTGQMPTRGNLMGGAPFGVFRARDGYVSMAIVGEKMWQRMCELIGCPELLDDPRLQLDRERYRHFDSVLRPLLEKWSADKTRKEVADAFLAADLPAGPIQNAADLIECPHLRARGMIEEFDDPNFGHVVLTGNPFKLSNVAKSVPRPAPLVGQDTDAVLKFVLGMKDEELLRLRESEII